MIRACLAACLMLSVGQAVAQSRPVYGRELEGFDYAYEVHRHAFTSQGQPVQMAYLDVAPKGTANGRTVVLLHGKNFCAGTWDGTIGRLTQAGYRVLALDQIGFCKSTKPDGYQFSFGQLATNTRALLTSLNVTRPIILGHSMGGMLAARYGLMFPNEIERLVMVDPLGLEDWQQAGVPFQPIDAAIEAETRTNFEGIKAYQLKFYYNGVWKPEYDRWVEMSAGLYAGGGPIVAKIGAQTSEMIYTQPVIHEFERFKVPTILIVGGRDRTAPGANRASPELAAKLGRYDELGKAAARRIPGVTFIEFPELAHSPQIESPDQFHDALIRALSAG